MATAKEKAAAMAAAKERTAAVAATHEAAREAFTKEAAAVAKAKKAATGVAATKEAEMPDGEIYSWYVEAHGARGDGLEWTSRFMRAIWRQDHV